MSGTREDLTASLEFSSKQSDPEGLYAALGVNVTADRKEIRQAFLSLSQAYHTDKHVQADADVQELMSARFQKIQEANDILLDPRKREAYDHSGSRGVARLALVPQTVSAKDDILRNLTWLEREAELRTISRQLSSRSSITATFLWAPLFVSARHSGSRRLEHVVADVEVEGTPPPPPPPQMSQPTPDQTHSPQVGQAEAPQLAHAQVSARIAKTVIDGNEVFVAILPDNVQKLLAAQGVPSGMGAGSAPARPGILGTLLTPNSIQMQHSYFHDVSNRVGVLLKASGSSGSGRVHSSLSAVCTFVSSCVSTFEMTVTIGVQQLALAVKQTRKLSSLWTLKSKLSLLDDGILLNQLKLTLSRVMAANCELANTICWSLTGNGFFQTVVASTNSGGSKGFVTKIASGSLIFTCFQQRTLIQSTTDPTQPVYRVQQNVTFDSLSGRTECGYEMWYVPNKLVRYGIGISAVLPVAFCPLAPPLFLSANNQFISITTVRLLYARGENQIQLPIVLSVSPRLSTGIFLLFAPWALYRVGSVLLRPIFEVRRAREVMVRRREISKTVDAARQKALREQAAIESTALKRRAVEDATKGGGLVIINARYGILQPQGPSLAPPYPLSVDVTVPLQHFVLDSKLLLPEGPKHGLVGFYDVDPATSDRRQLRITYWFRGSKHDVTLDEQDAVALPLVEHLCRNQQ